MNLIEWIDPRIAGWIAISLVHVLWQGAILAALAMLVTLMLRQQASQLRYSVHCVTLLLIAACLPLNLWATAPAAEVTPPTVLASTELDSVTAVRPTPASGDVGELIPAATAVPGTVQFDQEVAIGGRFSPERGTAFEAWWPHVSPWVVSAYLFGMAIMTLRLIMGLYGSQRLRTTAQPVKGSHLQSDLARLAKRIGLRVVPVVAMSARVTTPLVVGVLRPAILLPTAFVSGLRPEQVEALLLHELAHIRRWDHVVNLLQRIIETLLFFHPAVWWVSKRISIEREHCCDDLAVAWGGDACDYAESLVRVSELRYRAAGLKAESATVLAATGGTPSQLHRRVLRILGMPLAGPTIGLTRFGIAVLLTVSLSTAAIVANQKAPSQTIADPSNAEPVALATPKTVQAGDSFANEAAPVEPEAGSTSRIRKRHFVRVVVGNQRFAINGSEPINSGHIGMLRSELSKVPNREHTVLEYARTPNWNRDLQDEVFRVALELGFEYFSLVGFHPIDSIGTPSEYVVIDPVREAALQAIIRDIQTKTHRHRVQVVLLSDERMRIEGHLIERDQLLRVLRAFPNPTRTRLQVIRMRASEGKPATLSRFLGKSTSDEFNHVLWKVVADALGFAEVRWVTVDRDDKHWDFKFAIVGVWSGPGPEPVSLIFNPGGGYLDLLGESGTWRLEGTTLHREITGSPDSQRIGGGLEHEITQLDDWTLVLQSEDETVRLHRAIEFHGLTLQRFNSTTDRSRLSDIWEASPPESNNYELHSAVQIVRRAPDGTVYYRPDKQIYYVQADPPDAAQQTFYGPYRGNPLQTLYLPEVGGGAVEKSEAATPAASIPALQARPQGLETKPSNDVQRHRIALAELRLSHAHEEVHRAETLLEQGVHSIERVAQAREKVFAAQLELAEVRSDLTGQLAAVEQMLGLALQAASLTEKRIEEGLASEHDLHAPRERIAELKLEIIELRERIQQAEQQQRGRPYGIGGAQPGNVSTMGADR